MVGALHSVFWSYISYKERLPTVSQGKRTWKIGRRGMERRREIGRGLCFVLRLLFVCALKCEARMRADRRWFEQYQILRLAGYLDQKYQILVPVCFGQNLFLSIFVYRRKIARKWCWVILLEHVSIKELKLTSFFILSCINLSTAQSSMFL